MSDTAVFLGAGASREFKVPGLRELSDRIAQLQGPDGDEIRRLRRYFSENAVPFNVETLLAFLETSASRRLNFQESGPIMLGLAKGRKIFNLRSVLAHTKLARRIKFEIRNQCYVRKELLNSVKERFEFFLCRLEENRNLGLRAEIPQSNPTYPLVDFFTTNYDDSVEAFSQTQGIEATDGYRQIMTQVAGEQRFTYIFDENEFEVSSSLKIHKLYGSIRYAQHKDGTVIRIDPQLWERTGPGGEIKDLLIYPGATKMIWNEPQLQLFYRLQRKLRSSTLCVVIGYSFRDRAVTDVFLGAKRLNPSLRIFIVDPQSKDLVRRVFHKIRGVTPIPRSFEDFDPKMDLKV